MRIIELQNKIAELATKLSNLEGDKLLSNGYSLANYHQLEKSLLQVEKDINRLENYYEHSPEELKIIVEEMREEQEAQNILREIAPFYFVYKLNKMENKNS